MSRVLPLTIGEIKQHTAYSQSPALDVFILLSFLPHACDVSECISLKIELKALHCRVHYQSVIILSYVIILYHFLDLNIACITQHVKHILLIDLSNLSG